MFLDTNQTSTAYYCQGTTATFQLPIIVFCPVI